MARCSPDALRLYAHHLMWWSAFAFCSTALKLHNRDRTEASGSWLSNESSVFSWISFTWQQSPLCCSNAWDSPSNKQRKICISTFFTAMVVGCSECVCVFVCICVQVCACERGKESNSTYFNLPECKDTMKAIEGIKVLVIEPDWNLEHWTTTV